METVHQENTLNPVKKMGKLRASYLLTIEGLELLKKDKQVLLFPVFSMLANIAVVIFFCILYWIFSGETGSIMHADASQDFSSLGYVVLLVLYLATAFVATFFQAGLTAIVDARINGKSLTFQEGMNIAKAHAEKIFLWSLVSATVGVILGLISERSKWLGKLVAFFLSATWGIITFFIVPALILEEGNVSDSIKSSAGTFKKTWGETIIINFGAGLFLTLVAFSGILVVGLSMALAPPSIQFFASRCMNTPKADILPTPSRRNLSWARSKKGNNPLLILSYGNSLHSSKSQYAPNMVSHDHLFYRGDDARVGGKHLFPKSGTVVRFRRFQHIHEHFQLLVLGQNRAFHAWGASRNAREPKRTLECG
jgi:hypothetical protein